MREEWKLIEEFPEYAVSNFGRVMNTNTDLIKTPSPNQAGIPSVLFVKEHRQFRKTVSILVATHFLPKPPSEHFNTPINLDGDRFNNHVNNLVWRPRWYAVKYNRQFDEERPGNPYGDSIIDLATNVVYKTIWDAARTHGLLVIDIYLSIHNYTVVFPTNQRFEFVDI